mmetsp:Transcript_5916/g.15022  ORF Transcript_5916/g.15022 Transcript_5916/m.15022 type:complete len:271 (-) Transcript_5916:284-1096(-)
MLQSTSVRMWLPSSSSPHCSGWWEPGHAGRRSGQLRLLAAPRKALAVVKNDKAFLEVAFVVHMVLFCCDEVRVIGEKNCLHEVTRRLAGARDASWSEAHAALEGETTVDLDGERLHASGRRLRIIPDFDRADPHGAWKGDGDSVRLARTERRKPHVAVVVRRVHAVDKLVDCPRVALHLRQRSDARGVGVDAVDGEREWRARGVEELQPVEADVVAVAPRRVEDEADFGAQRVDRRLVVLQCAQVHGLSRRAEVAPAQHGGAWADRGVAY